MLDISIVIPALNEEDNLTYLLGEILRIGDREKWNYEIIVVDDNSSDSTGNILDSYAKRYSNIVVLHKSTKRKGIGLALRDGTKNARGGIIIWVMADRSDELKIIPSIIEKINEGYDMVIASRFNRKNITNYIFNLHFILSSIYSLMCKNFFKIPINDVSNAFRCFKKSIFKPLNLTSESFIISAEFSIKAQKYGFKLGEVRCKHYKRIVGKSKFNTLKETIKAVQLFFQLHKLR